MTTTAFFLPVSSYPRRLNRRQTWCSMVLGVGFAGYRAYPWVSGPRSPPPLSLTAIVILPQFILAPGTQR